MGAKTFSGGYAFRNFGGQPQDKLIHLDIPPKVIIPLSQKFGSALEPVISVGDDVYAGQIIACDDNIISSPIHSSISGKVTKIEEMNYFKRETTMVIIEGDGKDEYKEIEGHSSRWEKLSAHEIESLLYKSGATCLGREGVPTRFKTSIIIPEEVEDLIIHGAGSEAYNTSLEVLLNGKNLFKLVEGIKILKKIMPQAKAYLTLGSKKKGMIARIKKLTYNLEKFEIIPVVSKYPQGYDEVLVPTLLNQKFPYGYSAANIGIVILNTQAVLHAYEAVAEGKPLIERIIALCGPSFKEPIHIKARVGTPLEFILKGKLANGNSRIILNSLLTGFELNDFSLPIGRKFSQLIAVKEDSDRKFLAFSRPGIRSDSYSRAFMSSFIKKEKIPETNLHGEERPCVQCGYCMSVCPVSINPTLLDRHQKSGISEILMRYGIFNCIDCNLCSYVCPSKIPLARNLKFAKSKLIESGCDNSLCILPKFNLIGLEEYKGVKVVK